MSRDDYDNHVRATLWFVPTTHCPVLVHTGSCCVFDRLLLALGGLGWNGTGQVGACLTGDKVSGREFEGGGGNNCGDRT